jgi:indole-3-glycerol phosphate synthase
MILDEILAQKKREHAERAPVDMDGLWRRVEVEHAPRPFAQHLAGEKAREARAVEGGEKKGRISVIAEFKRRSPSAGAIREDADPGVLARTYEQAGAVALSVLTDQKFFGGSFEHLAHARDASSLPLLRKDFLLDERDLLESRLAGADAILLIVRILSPATLKALIDKTRAAGFFALVEAHNDAEIETALVAGADIIGVNHRDLDTLAIDLSLSVRARSLAPKALLVGESGIKTHADVAEMQARGLDAVLVGETLMRAADPGLALKELLG